MALRWRKGADYDRGMRSSQALAFKVSVPMTTLHSRVRQQAKKNHSGQGY